MLQEVMSWLEGLAQDDWRQWHSDSEVQNIAKAVLALLREQEAIKPYIDYDGQDVWRCGKCGNSLMHPSYYESDEDAKNYIRYCSHCGKRIKWE